MLGKLLSTAFGSRNKRELKRIGKIVNEINRLENDIKQKTDAELANSFTEFRQRFAQGESLKQLLPVAFATVREAAHRSLNLRAFDVQLVGGIVLYEGNIAEMRTGEGKTLVATFPSYLHAIGGQSVHIVTVNDYLARRDATWMGKVYQALGLSVGVVYSGQEHEQKKTAYRAHITYGTNSEFGFDFLRDNMVFAAKDKVQTGQHFAIIDEVDSILIDEARTPLIISGPSEDSSELYVKINRLIPKLKVSTGEDNEEEADEDGDFIINEKDNNVDLTEQGQERVEKLLREADLIAPGVGIYDYESLKLLHHINSGLRAHHIFKRDVAYLVRDGQVLIIDEHTGRALPGRRWSDGLHQALEAKEGLTIQRESQTLASITYQNYFRLYQTLAGMTGTADTEAYEFQQIYDLEVLVIPTNVPIRRVDDNDQIYLSPTGKFNALLKDVTASRAQGQPVLVGTASVETSEKLSVLFRKNNIEHRVLSAKQNESEAQIIAEAGRPYAVTIATNMAGRGTDIVLGGNYELELQECQDEQQKQKIKQEWQQRHDQVIKAGGLRVIGSERHESRRIDNQLRGRAGRQGDPGSSCFYLSLEDNLMRIFASDRVKSMMSSLGMEENEAIGHRLITQGIERAQRKVEERNFEMRKQILDFDDVANAQRLAVYKQRDELTAKEDVRDLIDEMRQYTLSAYVHRFIPQDSVKEVWMLDELHSYFERLGLAIDAQQIAADAGNNPQDAIIAAAEKAALEQLNDKEQLIGAENMRRLEKQIVLQVFDNLWKEHLGHMDHLRNSVYLRGYAQKNPKQEFKREGFELFNQLLEQSKFETTRILLSLRISSELEVNEVEQQRRAQLAQQRELAANSQSQRSARSTRSSTVARGKEKVGRNSLCPCGSGRKFKHCHGKA